MNINFVDSSQIWWFYFDMETYNMENNLPKQEISSIQLKYDLNIFIHNYEYIYFVK